MNKNILLNQFQNQYKFILHTHKTINFIFKIVINIYKKIAKYYINYFKLTVQGIENIIIYFYGEDYLEYLWDRWYFTLSFYAEVWAILQKKFLNKYEDIKLVLIWFIKRSDNCFIKLLKKYLSKYSWFNNNIIRF